MLLLPTLALAATAPPATTVTFFVKQRGSSAIREALWRVSDPDSAEWGNHLSHDEVIALQRPALQHTEAVSAHLHALGASSVRWTTAGDKVSASLGGSTASDAESLLPPALRHAVDFVSVDLARPRAPAPAKAPLKRERATSAPAGDPSACLYERVEPQCLRRAYGLNASARASAFNAQAVIVNQPFKPSDLAAFEREHGLPAQAVVKEVGHNSGSAGDEATLDVQFIIAAGQLVPTWWVYIDGHVPNPFASWLLWASNTSQIPWVHSLSVGEPEQSLASDAGAGAIARMNDEFAALGARGVSLVFASGDSGGAVAEQKYPASSPHVTAVGGVTWGAIFKEAHISVDGETTGGFSSLDANAAPPYQARAVQHFLHNTSGLRPQRLNASRRCVPDVSIYSTEYYIVQDGGETVIGGTSAAAPVLAGMLAAINDELVAEGGTPLGFANPFLYANADALLDVTHGDNGAYAAVAGYDPASGLGTFGQETFAELRRRAVARRAALTAARKAGEAADAAAADAATPELVAMLSVSDHRRLLEETFWAVAQPGGALYRKHLPLAQLATLLEPPPAVRLAAARWLETIGASHCRSSRTADALVCRWPAGRRASAAPRVPPELRGSVIDALLLRTSLEREGRPPRRVASAAAARRSNSSLGARASFGPAAQKGAYGVPLDLRGSHPNNSQMVWGTGTFGYREEDLGLFYSTYAPECSTSDVQLDVHNAWQGATGKNFVEGELDASYITAMAPGVKTVVANTNVSASTEAGEGFGPALLSFLVDLNEREQVPLVLSLSLGSLSFGSCDKACGALAAEGVHTYAACWAYLQTQFQACMFGSALEEARVDVELMKLGLRGVTVTAASGDGGSHFAFGPFSGPIGGALDELICKGLHLPVFPTASPYVLSVGGIQWSSDDIYGPTCSSSAPCGWSGGGGGFSWSHPMPAYQLDVTASYLQRAGKVAPNTAPLPGSFNASGRAYPDISALAQFGIPLCDFGGCSGSGGTSASAPTVAGLLSRA